MMDVNAAAVASAMRAAGVRRLIHGHTHRPAVHRFMLDAQPAERIVLGDWYTQGSRLRVSVDNLTLDALDPALATARG
jgi:UDP-2,3-diacylglucosamine hydrolase